MKKYEFRLAGLLVGLAIILHIVHYLIFKDLHHLFIFLVTDLAFIPLEVLFVTLVIDRGIEQRERETRLEKTNLLIGIFYDELGTTLLTRLVDRDAEPETVERIHAYCCDMVNANFKSALQIIEDHPHKIDVSKVDFYALWEILKANKLFIIQMISNPTLLEHETFTDLLQSLVHFLQELSFRLPKYTSQEQIDAIDVDYLKNDLERVYHYLTIEWTYYMRHLQEQYPFLFFTALLHNPYGSEQSHEFEKRIKSQLNQLTAEKNAAKGVNRG